MLASWNPGGDVAIQGAIKSLQQGNPVIRCLEHGLAVAEDDPALVSIGRGSLPNADGELELDASIMDGADMNCGAVCAMKGILPAITAARYVMERTQHNMIAGDQARRFAMECGLKPQNLMTTKAIEHYESYLESPEKASAYIHTVAEMHADTITMLGKQDDHFSAACSTSGLGYKLPGRVGDSPVIGASIFADNEAGCAGATGWGEDLWKACVSVRVVDLMRTGATAQDACEKVMREMVRRVPGSSGRHSVVFAMGLDGNHGVACVHKKFDLWIHESGVTTMETYEPLKN